jgi:hypothetical protein
VSQMVRGMCGPPAQPAQHDEGLNRRHSRLTRFLAERIGAGIRAGDSITRHLWL